MYRYESYDSLYIHYTAELQNCKTEAHPINELYILKVDLAQTQL